MFTQFYLSISLLAQLYLNKNVLKIKSVYFIFSDFKEKRYLLLS